MREKRPSAIWHVTAVASLVLFLYQDSLACSCIAPLGKKALAGAAAAFSGKVKKIEYLDTDQSGVEPRIIVTFEVYRSWKGPLKKSAVLHTIYNKWTCEGYFFKEGKEYLVFAHKNGEYMAKKFPSAKDTLGVNTCGATRLLTDAEEELRELGPGGQPE